MSACGIGRDTGFACQLAQAKICRVTPDQIKQGLGGDFLSQLAGKAGVSPDAASAQLSSLLPDIIDKLTPSGKIEAGGIDQLLKMFQGKIGE